MRFQPGEQVMLPDGKVGTVVNGGGSAFHESDADDKVIVEVSMSGTTVRRLFSEADLMENLRGSR